VKTVTGYLLSSVNEMDNPAYVSVRVHNRIVSIVRPGRKMDFSEDAAHLWAVAAKVGGWPRNPFVNKLEPAVGARYAIVCYRRGR